MITGSAYCVRNLDQTLHFYTKVLGMSVLETGPSTQRPAVKLGYSSANCGLYCVEYPQASQPQLTSPGYWKIGITVQDLDATVATIRTQYPAITDPVQFRDIGYLCHTQDPDGNTIELLQHTFYGNPLSQKKERTIAHISIRSADINRAIPVYTALGLRLLSKQATPSFDLYFLAETSDALPDPAIESVHNREWLWQRPYPCLEIQHIHSNPGPYQLPAPHHYGWHGLVLNPGNYPKTDFDGYPLLSADDFSLGLTAQ
ncbi:MAG: VOC family protein [Candidatus Marinamargulisbacteria bacterium]|nr:VOC family protein [Candidatus Marinamargulisbacteria bacterium]